MADTGNRKVLRIALIQDGKIVEERVTKPGDTVSIGDSPKAMFTTPGLGLPEAEFQLFRSTGKGYQLRFSEQVKGKVSSGDKALSLSKLRKDPSVARSGDVWSIDLSEEDRGKVDIGNVSILFQFVAPPPVQAVRSIQEMDFRPRLFEDDDPVFLMWLGVWSALGVMLALWVWNTEAPEFQLEELPDRFTKMVVETNDEPAPEIKPDENAQGESAAAKKESKQESKSKKAETAAEKAKRQEDMKREMVTNSKLLLKLIGSDGENTSGFVESMWSDDDRGLGDLDGALDGVSGVTTEGGPQLRSGEGGSGERQDIGDLGSHGGGTADVGSGPAVKAKPQVQLGDGSMGDDIGDKAGVKATVAKNYGQLRYCYESLLKKQADLAGRVEMAWSVYGGKVEGVFVVSNDTGSPELAECIKKRITMWEFDDSVEGDISWPFVFRTAE